MSPLRYSPAPTLDWLAVASPERLLVVELASDPASDQAHAERLVAVVDEGLQQVLDALTGHGLSATPSFALLEWAGTAADPVGIRAIVRGPALVSIVTAEGPVKVDGLGVTTWSEQRFLSATAFEVSLDAAATRPWLPLVAGAAYVTRISSPGASSPAGPGHAEAAAHQEEPAPDPEPVPAAVGSARQAPFLPVDEAEAPPMPAHALANGGGRLEVPEATQPAVSAFSVRAPGGSAIHDAAIYDQEWHESAAETARRRVAGGVFSGAAGDLTEQDGGVAILAGAQGGIVMTEDPKKLRSARKSRAARKLTDEVPQLYLELSTGGTEALNQTVVVGRSPSASAASGAELPRLVTIPGDQDISRNHAQIAVEGGAVVVTDLNSRNGTQVVIPGKPAQQLRQGEPTPVLVGTIVDLGGGVTLTVREEA